MTGSVSSRFCRKFCRGALCFAAMFLVCVCMACDDDEETETLSLCTGVTDLVLDQPLSVPLSEGATAGAIVTFVAPADGNFVFTATFPDTAPDGVGGLSLWRGCVGATLGDLVCRQILADTPGNVVSCPLKLPEGGQIFPQMTAISNAGAMAEILVSTTDPLAP